LEKSKITVGLMGFGKAGSAVATVIAGDPRFELRWIARRRPAQAEVADASSQALMVGLTPANVAQWFIDHPVDAVIDFSHADAIFLYGEEIRKRGLMVVSAISAYSPAHLNYLKDLGKVARVMSSPNLTLGINFLLTAAKLLRSLAPFADVEIVEQHFRDKPEVSGTARVIADNLNLDKDKITSLRLGGIVGHHEVIFGFPHQTVRLVHDSIRREAFGTGAAFALQELALRPPGFFTFDDLLMHKIKSDLLSHL
jgi:4-hydroxy-tetrahydrodipicolinate reductase